MQNEQVTAQAPTLTKSQQRLLRCSIESFSPTLLGILEAVYRNQSEITIDYPADPKKASANRWKIIQMLRVVRTRIQTAHITKHNVTERERELHRVLSSIRVRITYTGEPGHSQTSHLTIWTIHTMHDDDPDVQALRRLQAQTDEPPPYTADAAPQEHMPEPPRLTQEEIINKYFSNH